MGCPLEVSEGTILVASVPRLHLGINRLLCKMFKRKFFRKKRASIQFFFFIIAVNNLKPHRFFDRKDNA